MIRKRPFSFFLPFSIIPILTLAPGLRLYRTARYPEAAEFLRKACGAEDALTQNASYHLADCYLRAGDTLIATQKRGPADL